MKTKTLFTNMFLFISSIFFVQTVTTPIHAQIDVVSGIGMSFNNENRGYRAPCIADIGTFTSTTNGIRVDDTTFVLCFNQGFSINSNSDYTPPAMVTTSEPNPPTYDPGMAWALFSCPPTYLDPLLGVDLIDDPCYLGLSGGESISNINNLSSLLQYFPTGTFTDNIIYFVPITTYGSLPSDPGAIVYSYVQLPDPPCYAYGNIYSVQYLPRIIATQTSYCQSGEVSVNLSGGSPAINGTNFTASNLLPSSASLSATTIGNGGTLIVSGLNNGDSYSFNIVDDYGCPLTVSGTFTGVSSSSFSYSKTDYCKGDGNPFPTITGQSGGTFSVVSGPPGLSLDPTTGIINISTSSTGTFVVSYTSPGAPCNSVTNRTVTISELPVISAGSDVTICEGESTTISASGPSGASYIWNQGLGAGQSKTVNPNSTTTYEVTGTDTKGCVNTDVITVSVNIRVTPTFSSISPFCSGSPAPTLPTASNNGISGTWAPGIISNTSSGVYTFTPNSNECATSGTINVTVNPAPNADAGSNINICEGDNLNLSASGGTSYSWSGPNSFSSNVQNPVINNAGAIASGIYTVTVSNSFNCSANDVVNVSVNANPTTTPSFAPNNPICPGQTLNLQATGSNSNNFVWTGPNGFTATVQNPSISNAGVNASGNYSVTVTDNNNCTTTESVNVIIIDNDPPVFNGGCLNDTLLFSGISLCEVLLPDFTSNSNLNITDNCGDISNNTISITQNPPAGSLLGEGTHTIWIIATDEQANVDSCSFQLTVEDTIPPLFNGGCIDDTTLFAGNTSCDIIVPDFTGNSQLDIVDNCGNIASNTITVTQSPTAGTTLGIGTHTIWVYAEDNNSNIDSCFFQLHAVDSIPPTFNSGCIMDTTLLSGNASCSIVVPDFTSSNQLNITDNCGDVVSGTITITQNPPAGSVLQSGLYTGWLYVEDNHSNVDSCSFNIIVAGDTIAPTFPNGCISDTIIYSMANACAVEIPDFTESSQIQVEDNCNDLSTGTIGITQNPVAGTSLDVGVHEIWIIATDQSANADSCSFFITVIDTIPPLINIDLSSSSYCEGENVTWTADITDNCLIDSISSTHQSGNLFPIGTTTVSYTVVDVNGNVSVHSFEVTVNSLPSIPTLDDDNYLVCNGSPVELSMNNSDINNTYSWVFNGNVVGTGTTYEIEPSTPGHAGTYTVEATSSNGCMSSSSEIVLTVENCGIIISGGISPNGDGLNDVFEIDGLEAYPNTEVWIYNRWGTEVFHSEDYQNDWDGTSQSSLNVGGNELPEGTYYYIIKLGGYEGQPNAGETYKGYVYLKR